MTIKQATINDLNQVAQLFDEYRVFYEQESNIELATNFISDRIIKNESIIYVAETDNKKLVGYAQLFPIFSSVKMKRLWLLNDLFVNENYRSQGISVNLIDRCKQLAIETNASGLLLETATTNVIGNNLYIKTGFELDHVHNFYYWNNK